MRLRHQIGVDIAFTVLRRYLARPRCGAGHPPGVRPSAECLRTGARRCLRGIRRMTRFPTIHSRRPRPRRSATPGKHSGRSLHALLPISASECWLARLATSPHWSRFDLPGGVLLAVAIPALRRGSAECAGLIAGRGLVVTVSIRVLGDGGLEYSTTASTWRRRSTPSKQATNVDGRLDAGSMKSSNPNLPLPPTFSAEREIDDAVGPLVSLRRSRDHGQIPDRHCH